jgi:hypothetical protein
MRCNHRIQLDKNGQQETYCQRKAGHDGEHSIYASGADDPFAPRPEGVQLVLPVRIEPAKNQPGVVPDLPGGHSATGTGLDEVQETDSGG